MEDTWTQYRLVFPSVHIFQWTLKSDSLTKSTKYALICRSHTSIIYRYGILVICIITVDNHCIVYIPLNTTTVPLNTTTVPCQHLPFEGHYMTTFLRFAPSRLAPLRLACCKSLAHMSQFWIDRNMISIKRKQLKQITINQCF